MIGEDQETRDARVAAVLLAGGTLRHVVEYKTTTWLCVLCGRNVASERPGSVIKLGPHNTDIDKPRHDRLEGWCDGVDRGAWSREEATLWTWSDGKLLPQRWLPFGSGDAL